MNMANLMLFIVHTCYVDIDITHCVDITLIDVNCTSEWDLHRPHGFTLGSTQHPGTYKQEECRKVCEFDPRCVAVNWHSSKGCWIESRPDHRHSVYSWKNNRYWRHHDLVRRCNITSGRSVFWHYTAVLWIHQYGHSKRLFKTIYSELWRWLE